MSRSPRFFGPGRDAGLAIALAALFSALAGCAREPRAEAKAPTPRFTVALPPITLAANEYIQSVAVDVHSGRVVSVNRLQDDWDYQVTWDHPGLVTVTCLARHFPAGLSDTKPLAGFLTVEATDTEPLQVTATVETESPTPTGRPDRTVAISETQIILSPVK